jgi:hypothetical protein
MLAALEVTLLHRVWGWAGVRGCGVGAGASGVQLKWDVCAAAERTL